MRHKRLTLLFGLLQDAGAALVSAEIALEQVYRSLNSLIGLPEMGPVPVGEMDFGSAFSVTQAVLTYELQT